MSPSPRFSAFVIHLDRAVDRRPQVEELLAALEQAEISAAILRAVDGQKLSPEDLAAYRPNLHQPHYPFALRLGEIACFLSHRQAWARIAEAEAPGAFVFEDDVRLDPRVFGAALALARPFLAEERMIRLPVAAKEDPKEILAEAQGLRLFTPAAVGLRTHGQWVGRAAAARLLAATQAFDRPIDTTLQMPWITGAAPLSLLPSGLSERSQEIGGSKIGARKTLAERLRREILRPLYRFRLALATRRAAGAPRTIS